MRLPRIHSLVLALLCATAGPAFAQDPRSEPDLQLIKPLPLLPGQGFVGQILMNPQAGCNPAWVGHAAGTFFGVTNPATWRFDQSIAGTDSTQGWHRWDLPYRIGPQRPATARPEWALDYGNSVNTGNSNLTNARALAGRKHVLRGIAGVWHSDNMAGVKLNVSDGAEPSSTPIAGSASAWCGLRQPGSTAVVDELTGNYINGDLQLEEYGQFSRSEFPGYSNLWDQMLYKDFPSTAAGTVSFTYRSDLSNYIDPVQNGSGWFNPDPTNIANFVLNPADSFMVYAGSPTEIAYDTNRRWFSEVLNLTQPMVELFAVSGKHSDTPVTVGYTNLVPVGGLIRIVFRVKTNRVRSDETTNLASGFNSKDGAAMIDNVSVNGSALYGFETAGAIKARSLILNLSTAGGPWATTGRPPSSFFHIDNINALIYEDLNGAVGAPTRLCDLEGNVFVAGDHDNTEVVTIEHYQAIESPTINLAIRNTPGGTNSQGITDEMAKRPSILLEYDWYSGFMSLDESVFWNAGVRFHGPNQVAPISSQRQWSPIRPQPFLYYNPSPICQTMVDDLSMLGAQLGQIDSLRVLLLTQTQGWRWGGTNLGNTRGTYFDNVSVGLYDAGQSLFACPHLQTPRTQSGPGTGPPIAIGSWAKLQDTFPFNEAITPGDNASFDTTTALMTSALNIVLPVTDPGVVAGDSMVVNAQWTGNGVTTGTRVDLVFRIDPGPGDYVVRGDRSSALINKDPAHPFYLMYLANNGAFGTPGGHAGTWNKDVWNSCRIDSAEINIEPLVSRGIGGPVGTPYWMATIHEQDPTYSVLGIVHNKCFLIDPTGLYDETNIDCAGITPAPYGAVSAVTKEGTKVLPDGWFSPGTHIEYFVRSSFIEDVNSYTEWYDSREVYPHSFGAYEDRDQERYAHVDVLPDMWKSQRYNGAGLACLLLVDGADRRGTNPAYRSTADTCGFGKPTGPSQGWKRSGTAVADHATPNNPADFVDANLGQYGLSYDQFDIGGSESWGSGRLGSRLATNGGNIALKGSKQGPSMDMLTAFYNTIVWASGDLADGTLHDGFDPAEGSRDVDMIASFLDLADPQNTSRAVWLAGDGIMEDGALKSDNGTILYPFLTDYFGADLSFADFKSTLGASPPDIIGFLPLESWSSPGDVYGLDQTGSTALDVLTVVPTVSNTSAAADYDHLGTGPWTSSVYRTGEPGRPYRTLLDGFDATHLRTHVATNPSGTNLSISNLGRLSWIHQVLGFGLQTCLRKGPIVGIGDIPGSGGEAIVTQMYSVRPNPAPSNTRVVFHFSLERAQDVRLAVYSVSGRRIATIEGRGQLGPNILEWDRRKTDGSKALPGVYFYALDAGGSSVPAKDRKLVLLGP